MKIMVISDTHGNHTAPLALLDDSGVKMLVHLGDLITDVEFIEPILDIPLLKVPGNCDHGATEPRELIETIAARKFLITHGDMYRVKNGLEALVKKAASLRVDVVLYGHTHSPCVHKLNGILLVNPGALMLGNDAKSYAILTIKGSNVAAEIIHLP